MLNPDDINKLNDYSYNRSSKEDRKELEKQMKENPEFEKEAGFFFGLFRGFKALELDKFNDNMQKWESKHQKGAVPTGKIVYMQFVKYAVAAAVVVVTLFVGYNSLNSGMTSDEIFASNFSHSNAINYLNSRGAAPEEDPALADEATAAMSEEEKIKAEELRLKTALEQATIAAVLNKGISAYNNHNYSDAKKYFEAYMTTDNAKDKDEVEFYLAVSYLAEGQLDKARPMFEKMSKAVNKTRKSDAEWYLVLTLVKEKNIDLASKKLDAIVKKPSHIHKEKALKLQEQIEKHYVS